MTNPSPAPELPDPPELVCPAGSLRALQAAVEAGADAVYLGLKDATNARNFAGLNFDDAQVRDGVVHAHARGAKVLMALNTFADARWWRPSGRGRPRRRRPPPRPAVHATIRRGTPVRADRAIQGLVMGSSWDRWAGAKLAQKRAPLSRGATLRVLSQRNKTTTIGAARVEPRPTDGQGLTGVKKRQVRHR